MEVVWVVTGYSAESYEDYSWIDSVHSTEEGAVEYIKSLGTQPILEPDDDDHSAGYFLHQPECFKVQPKESNTTNNKYKDVIWPDWI